MKTLVVKPVFSKSELEEEPIELKSKNDEELRKIFDNERMYELNTKILFGVTETYKNKMTPICTDLLENDAIIGRIEPNSDDEIEDDDYLKVEFKNPYNMSSFELFKESSLLSMHLKKIKEENKKDADALEILTLAKEGLDLYMGCRMIELNMGGTSK